MKLGLGRRFAPDPRDAAYRVAPLLAAARATATLPARTSRYWYPNGWWGDQGETSMCVAFAWAHWLEDGPVTQPGRGPIVPPEELYHAAQLVDEWPGTDYDGTSVRAGAKVLKARGLISAYHWAVDLRQLAETVLELGPVVVGTNWYAEMFEPDEAGFIRVGGELAGGHAWLLDGVNTKAGYFRMKNSWGRTWGNRGFALVAYEDMARLLAESGEACLAVEVRKAAA